jgi:hypothetical protein
LRRRTKDVGPTEHPEDHNEDPAFWRQDLLHFQTAPLLGIVAIVVFALLEVRHLARNIARYFDGCRSIGDLFGRLLKLDDVTLFGLAMCTTALVAIGWSALHSG